MFNFRNKEEKKYKGTTLYVTKLEDVEIEKVLAILFSMFEGYIRQENKLPEKIVLSKNNYDRITDYNSKLILKEDDKEYILCVELEVKRDRRR